MDKYEDHDLMQAERRSPEQNIKLIEIIMSSSEGELTAVVWGYTNVPPEGGPVDLMSSSGERWTIDVGGEVTHYPAGQ